MCFCCPTLIFVHNHVTTNHSLSLCYNMQGTVLSHSCTSGFPPHSKCCLMTSRDLPDLTHGHLEDLISYHHPFSLRHSCYLGLLDLLFPYSSLSLGFISALNAVPQDNHMVSSFISPRSLFKWHQRNLPRPFYLI